MRKLAREIVGRQEALLNAADGDFVEIAVSDRDSDDGFEVLHITGHDFRFKVTSVTEDEAHVILQGLGARGPFEIEFDVTYYDMPLVDYTTLHDGHRFAVTFKGKVLREGKPAARLRVFEFDKDRVLARDRPTLESIQWLLKRVRASKEPEDE